MVFHLYAGILIIYVGTAACVFVIAGYFLLRRRKLLPYVLALVISVVLASVVRTFFTVTIIEYTADYKIKERISIGFPLYKATDSQEIPLRRGGHYLYINASNVDLVIVPFVYGETSKDYYVYDLYTHSHFFYDEKPDYYINHIPPKQLYTKEKGEVRFWLTTREFYLMAYPEAKEEYLQEE